MKEVNPVILYCSSSRQDVMKASKLSLVIVTQNIAQQALAPGLLTTQARPAALQVSADV